MREVVFVGLAVLVATAAAREILASPDVPTVRAGSAGTTAARPQPMSEDSLESLGSQVVDGDVFRIARHGSSVAYDGRARGASLAAPLPMSAPLPPKSVLTLKAIIGGPPWQGVIDGFPGHPEGTLVTLGDKIERFTVKGIGRDTVVIQAPDTLYRLTLKRDW